MSPPTPNLHTFLKKTPNPHISHPPVPFSLFTERCLSSSSTLIVRPVPACCLPLHRGLQQRSTCSVSTAGHFPPSPTRSDEQATSLLSLSLPTLLVAPSTRPIAHERSGGDGDCDASCWGCRGRCVLCGVQDTGEMF
jgi:hypothetical protein